MNLFTVEKPPIIKLLTYAILGLAAAFASTIPLISIIPPIFLLLSAAFFALCIYHIGILGLIPSLVPFVTVFVVNDLLSALIFLPSVILSLSLGFALRCKNRPVEKIVISAIAYILSSLIVYALTLYVATGTFDLSELFGQFGGYIEEMVLIISDTVQKSTGISISNVGIITDFIKSIMLGTYIAIELTGACFVYCLSVIISKIARDIKFDHKPLDIRLSGISSVIFLISMFATLLMNIPSDSIKYYTTLFINLFFILSPLFFVSGIYYIFKIKFKVEKSSPAGLVVAVALSFMFGIFAIALYIAYSGALYSLKYNKLDKMKGDQNAPKQ